MNRNSVLTPSLPFTCTERGTQAGGKEERKYTISRIEIIFLPHESYKKNRWRFEK